MNLSSCIGGIFFSSLVIAHAVAGEPCEEKKGADQVIPLDQVLFGGSGSRQFRDLEPELMARLDTPEKIAKYSTPEGYKDFMRLIEKGRKESLALAIERAMQSMPMRKDAKMGHGFAVEGQGRAAIKGIFDVPGKGKEPKQRFSADKELSLVFYNRPMQPGIRLESVTRIGDVFEIQYMLVSHGLKSISWNLGLVPVGKLKSGDYRVNLERCEEREAEFNERGFPPVTAAIQNRYISSPFSFVVEKEKANGGLQ
jgi:hypothetical protein